MSLRKSPQLTPALLAAARQNAQHSTRPRSSAAKRNSKLNWRMMLRQEAALDCSIDPKVRILLRLRKESANPPLTPPTGHDDEPRMENVAEALDSDIVPDDAQGIQAVESLKMNDRCGNVTENKGLA
jgi:hypothetical protein